MRNRFILVLALALLPLSGCTRWSWWRTSNQPAPASKPSPAASAPSAFATVIRLKIVSIEVPVGTASGSEEIWSYLDEERTRAVRSAGMARNGLRLGVARADAWPDLARALQKMTGQRLQDQDMLALPGRPTAIELKIGQEPQMIFTSREDRTLSGADYPAGDNLLALTCSIDETDTRRILITGVPQIRSSKKDTAFIPDPNGLLMVDRPTVFTLSEVTFQLTMANNEILVIGPGDESRRPSSIGHHFLVRQKQDMDFETLLVIVPEVVKAPIHTEPIPQTN